MKLHLPKMLAAAVLAAITSISAYAAVPAYSGTIYTWNGTTTGQDPARGVFCTTTYDGDTPNVQEDNISGWTDPVQGMIASLNTVPSNTLRFDSSHGQSVQTLNYTFGPFVLGGIIVEEGATGFSINSSGANNRHFFLGNSNEVAAFSTIKENFSVNKTSGGEKMYLRGTQTIDIASGRTFTLQSNNGIDLSGNLTTTGSGTLAVTTGDVMVASAATLTFNSNVTISHALSVSVSGISEGGSPVFTLNGTGNLSLSSFALGGMGSLENGTYAIANTTEAMADTLTRAFSGTEEYKLSYESGILKLTVASSGGPIPVTSDTNLLFSETGTRGYEITNGALKIGNGNGGQGSAAAGLSYGYGPIVVDGESSSLRVWHWTGSAPTLNTNDKVSIASPITVKDGGTIFMEDGSYHFADGVKVDGSGSIQMQWAKGALLDSLTSVEGTAADEFTFTALGKDPADRTQLYGLINDGDFAGTVKLDTRGAGPLHFSIGSAGALKNAMLDLGDGSHSNIVALNTAETSMRGIRGKGSIALATNLTGHADISASTLNLTGTGSTFSGSIGEGVTIAVAKGADLTLSGALSLYTGLDVTGSLTLNPDLVIDLTHLSYEDGGTQLVYRLATLAEGASYTGYNALTAASVTGVVADNIEFNKDGTIVITKAAPHAVTWDPNWKLSTGPDVLSASLTESTALITSAYKTGSDVTVELTGTGNEGAYIYGVQDSDKDQTGGTFTTNVWINAKDGSYKAIVGGSYCNNWNGGGALNLEGDTHIQLDGATVGTVIGGNLKDGKSPTFVGSSYISVISGDVTATIIGSSTNSHSANPVHTGNTNIFIYVPLSTESTNALSANQAPHLGDYVIGGGAHVDNGAGGTNKIDGNTNITIDLSEYADERTTFVKSVVGGHFSENSSHGQIITGSTNVTIKGGSIQFTRDIIGGSYFNSNSNSSTIDGGVSLSIEGGIYSGNVIGGTKVTNSAGSTVGAVEVSLSGTAQISGNVYAAGLIDGDGTGASTVASTTVNLGADVIITGTLSGGFGGTGAARGTVSGMRILNLNEAEEYTNLTAATLAAFDEISVAGGASAAVSGISGTSALDKTGSGALTLSGAFTLDTLTVSAGRLTFDATGTEIGTVSVVSGATLSSTDAASTKAAVTLDAGSTLSVGTAGLALESGSEFTLSGGKINFSYTGTLGQEIIVASGLTVDTIHGISFNQSGPLGDYAIAADYLTMDAQLADYTQLRVKDGNLILGKTAGGGSYWGAGIGPGTWDMASPNWADDDNLTATRTFTPANAAHFTAAGSGGEISVGTGIDVTTIYVSGSKAYTFTNADRLTISGGINVSDSGKATFDKLGGEIKSISIADADSALTVSNGGASVQTLNNAGTLTVKDTLTLKTATTNGGNVTAKNLTLTGENAFAAVNVAGTVSGAASIKVGGTSVIGTLSGVNKLNLADGTLKLDAATGLNETTLSGALTAGGGVGLGSVAMNEGSSIQSTGEVSASGITVTGTADILAGTKLQTATVGGTGTLKVASGSTVGGSNLSVADNATLELLEGSTLANTGTLSVAGKVIAGNGINLGTANVSGTLQTSGGVGATALTLSGGTLTSTGTLTVDNNLTVNGAASVENVVIGGNLAMGAASGALTATGTLDAGTITLGRVSAAECYITANALSTTATDFVVDEAYITSQSFSVGTTITLADLATDYAGTVTVNGKSSFTDTNRRVYTIVKNSGGHDIVLTVEQQASGFVWTGNEDTLWSTSGNWSGSTVPGSGDWVQVMNDTHPHDIELDGDAEVSYFSVSATDATLRGNHTLEVGSALEVNVNGILYVGDGSTPTAIETPTATINGTLVVQPGSTVKADATTITGGTLNVNNATYTAKTIDMVGGTLRGFPESNVSTEQLYGDTDSIVGGRVVITGTGSRYTGGYDEAYIVIAADADATLYAHDGLTLGGDGTAKLQYSGDTAIGGVDAGDLNIILNDPTSSNIGSTLTLQNPSAMEAGSITFGMSAIDSASTINTNRIPVIIDATDFAVGNETTVVVNQDKTQDTGIAMAVGNNGKTRNLVLARVGADNTNTDSVVLNGNLYGKYFKNARIEHGALLVDMNDTYYQTISGATSFNGRAGAGMLDDAFVENNPQISNPTGDLAAVMTALEQGAISSQEADRVLSAMSGASHAAMGAAWSRDVDRQLRAIRNRTTSMGVAECVVNEEMPFINVWINAEGDYTKLNNDGTLAGYKLSSWGGTVGVDVDFTNRFTMGLAVTAMSGDFTACSADNAEGDLDRLYVSVFGRYTHRAWTHTLVGTFGMADTNLKRTVDYGVGSYTTNSSSDGTAFGLMYEVGYTVALNENATTCLQPVLNLSYRHSSLDGCSETGTDAALRGDDVDMDVFTIALGARLQSVVGTSVYNRSSIFEGRVLCKLDAGDREASTHNSFVNVGNKREVRSSEMGAFGLELGAGLVVPIAEDGGSIFFDVSAEIRDKYTEVNGTVGYRYNF